MIRRLALLALIILPCLVITAQASAYSLLGTACKGNTTSATCNQASTQGTTDPIAGSGGIISKAATIIALITGVGAIIMMILGGFALTVSGGNPEATKKARQRVISALIGLAVIGLAWALVLFVTNDIVG